MSSEFDRELERRVDLVTYGEALGLFVRESPETDRYLRTFVGAESNVAVTLRGLGHSVRWIGRLGTDELGQYIETELLKAGVDVVASRDIERNTGLMLKELTEDGTQIRYYRKDSAASQGAEHLSAGLLRDARVLHLTGVTPALSDRCRDAIDGLFHMAQDSGVLVSFDVNYRASLWSSNQEATEVLVPLAQKADLVFVGQDESSSLLGAETIEEFARAVLSARGQVLIFKLGADGAIHADDANQVFEPAIPGDVVDVTGAGDGFAAGYLAGLLRGSPPRSRLRLGHLIANRVIRVTGDLGELPNSKEVSSALDPANDENWMQLLDGRSW